MSTRAKTAKNPYQELTEIVRARGWFEKAPGRMLFELGVHLTLHFGGLALLIFSDNLWVRIAALLPIAYGGLGIATNTHTSSHNATSRSLRLNRALTYFGYTFLYGASAHFWWNKHCVVHHPAPNMIGVDDDADLMPFFALNQEEVKNSRGFRRFFYRIQWLFVPPAIAVNTFFTQLQGWQFLVPILFDPKRRKAAHWLDLGVLFLHYAAWIVIPMFFFAPLDVLAVYVIRMVLMGYAMFVAFAPAHFPAEAAFIDQKLMDQDYLFRQTATTINFRTGFLGRLVCSGVDFQIEHHLFPGVPHHRHPEIARVVEDFCRDRGYPYRTLGWWEATWKSLLVFYQPKEVFADAEPLRAPQG